MTAPYVVRYKEWHPSERRVYAATHTEALALAVSIYGQEPDEVAPLTASKEESK